MDHKLADFPDHELSQGHDYQGPRMTDSSTAREFRLPKIFNFTYFAALAAIYPFLPLYYEDLGLSGGQIGVLIGVFPLMTTASASLWGGLADSTGRHNILLKMAIVGAIIGSILVFLSGTFLSLFLSVLLFSAFTTPIVPLVDNTILQLLGEDSDQYGRFRLWGSIGWGIGAPLVGTVVGRLGLQWSFFLYAALMGLTLLTTTQFRIDPAKLQGRFREGLGLLLSDRGWIRFLSALFIAGIGLAVVDNFLFLHLRSIGASESLMGITLTVGTASEVILFMSSDRILSSLGTRKLMTLAIAALVVQLLSYSILRVPWPALIIQALHGPSFAGLWMAGVSFANRMAPQGMGATAQGLLSTVLLGLGAIAGSLMGGQLLDLGGSAAAFLWAGLLTVISLLILLTPRRAD
jgi:PPP family 3-phenylpropionic acid transporter